MNASASGAGGGRRGLIASWVASWTPEERPGRIARVRDKAAAVRAAVDPGGEFGEGELLAAAVFLEYAEWSGVCPTELHWLMNDPLGESEAGAAALGVEVMVEDAVGRASARMCADMQGRPREEREERGRGGTRRARRDREGRRDGGRRVDRSPW